MKKQETHQDKIEALREHKRDAALHKREREVARKQKMYAGMEERAAERARTGEDITWTWKLTKVDGQYVRDGKHYYTDEEIAARKTTSTTHTGSTKPTYRASPYGANDWRSREESKMSDETCVMM